MSNRLSTPLGLAAGGALAAVALAWCTWGPRVALSIAAGGAWNLASLFCLAQLLGAWLGPPRPPGPPFLNAGAGADGKSRGGQPSRRRAILWLLVKFPLLYLFVFGLLRAPSVSLIGFGAGFTVVLAGAVAGFALQNRRLVHGR